MLKCHVIDTGAGIEPGLCVRLFAPFVKGSDAKGMNKSGAGLGLAISKSLCERLGGHIRVKSVLNRGSDFAFTIATNLDATPGPESAPLDYTPKEPTAPGKPAPRSTQGTPRVVSVLEPSRMRSSCDSKTESSAVAKEVEKGRSCGCPQVLAVDDAYFNRFTLKRLLQKLGQSCDEVLPSPILRPPTENKPSK
jgi:hypothetical protein